MREVTDGESVLFGDHIVTFNKKHVNDLEIVLLPAANGCISTRQAKFPYACTLHLKNGKSIMINTGDTDDWGNIQPCTPGDCADWSTALGWGNDADGHVKIVKVTDVDGQVIPLKEFMRDVNDLVPLHSDD